MRLSLFSGKIFKLWSILRTDMTSPRISQLEAEIDRHKRFLELPDLFTLVSVIEKQKLEVQRYKRDTENHPSRGILVPDLDYWTDSDGTEMVGSKFEVIDFPIHFRDNTGATVLRYLKTKQSVKFHSEGWWIFRSIRREEVPYQLVLREELSTRKIKNDVEQRYNPPIVCFPTHTPLDFYMSPRGSDPVQAIRSFKDYILERAKDSLYCAQQQLANEYSSRRTATQEASLRKKQQEKKEQLTRELGTDGMKI